MLCQFAYEYIVDQIESHSGIVCYDVVHSWTSPHDVAPTKVKIFFVLGLNQELWWLIFLNQTRKV